MVCALSGHDMLESYNNHEDDVNKNNYHHDEGDAVHDEDGKEHNDDDDNENEDEDHGDDYV